MTGAQVGAHDPITTKVTFAREIRAILSAHCANCHAPGGPAPMPLTTYEEVRPWARAIKEQVLTRRMPTWHAARGYGAFSNDPTLTPFEMALVVSWVDGGLPRGEDGKGAKSASGAKGANGANGALAVTVPARADSAVAGGRSRWVTGWSFEPGDPLITSATVSSDGGALGTWVAGDAGVTLPAGHAFRVRGRVRVEIRRRAAADYERPFTARRSVLRFTTRAGPARRAWIERVSCGAARAGRPADVIAVQPVLPPSASARVAIERLGAPATIVGWFRDFDPSYPRTYWLARPVEFGADARLASDAPCAVSLLLTTHTP